MAYGSSTSTKIHYTAIVDIQQVTTKEDPGTGRGDDTRFKNSREVTKLVIRAKTLEGLKTKVAAHIQLVGDED